MKSARYKGIMVVVGVITALIFSRLIPHMPNYTPIGAATLFGAAYFGRKYLAVLVPLVAIYISDLILMNTLYADYYESAIFFHFFQIFTIGSIVLTVLLGMKYLKKITLFRVLGSAVGASVIFFLLTNFGTWAEPISFYPKNMGGLISAYIAGIPFFVNTLLSNLFFSAVIFGAYEYFTKTYPSFKLVKQQA